MPAPTRRTPNWRAAARPEPPRRALAPRARARDAVIVAGERLVPEALQGAEIVAVGQPLEFGPPVTRD